MFRTAIPLLLLLLPPAAEVSGQEPPPASPLTLAEVLAALETRNPALRAARSRVDSRAAREPGASLLPDPELQVGFMNASLPELRFDMPASMRPSIQLMQRLPVPGTLRLEGEMARRETAVSGAMADETAWQIRAGAVASFLEIWRLDRQVEVLDETLEWLTRFEEAALARYAAGSGVQGDVLRAGVESARMEAERLRMRAMRRVEEERLNAFLDAPPGATVPAVVLPELPATLPTREELERWAVEQAPELTRGALEVEQARTAEALARRELWPDVAVGVQYGQRPSEMGTERMGSLMLGVEVPVFAGRRQLQRRREAAAEVQAAEAELAWARAGSRARIGALVARLEEGRGLVTLYNSSVLPQAEAALESALASYPAGRVDFTTLLEGLMALNRYRQELLGLVAEYGERVAELEGEVGRELPPTAERLEGQFTRLPGGER